MLLLPDMRIFFLNASSHGRTAPFRLVKGMSHLMHTVTYAASLHLLQQHVGSLLANILWYQLTLLTLHTCGSRVTRTQRYQ